MRADEESFLLRLELTGGAMAAIDHANDWERKAKKPLAVQSACLHAGNRADCLLNVTGVRQVFHASRRSGKASLYN
jgi:hypothetical protein